MKRILICFTLLVICLGAAQAGVAAEAAISFNKAPAEQIVQSTDGLVDMDLAKAIVQHRTQNGPFKSPEDVRKVPGMKTVIFNSLGLKAVNGDVVYSPEVEPGMKAY